MSLGLYFSCMNTKVEVNGPTLQAKTARKGQARQDQVKNRGSRLF